MTLGVCLGVLDQSLMGLPAASKRRGGPTIESQLQNEFKCLQNFEGRPLGRLPASRIERENTEREASSAWRV